MAKRKNNKQPVEIVEESDMYVDSPVFANTGIPQYTLLDVPDRVKLPPIPSTGRPCFLIQMATEQPDLYKQLITLIRHGASGNVAAERWGIHEQTFYSWAKIARKEMLQDEVPDTFYTRFYSDVRRAIAMRTSEIEVEIAVTDPKKWLSHGPGRIFGDRWTDSTSPRRELAHDPTNPAMIPSVAEPQGEELLASSPPPPLSSSQEKAAKDITIDNPNQPEDSNTVEGSFTAIQINESISNDALKVLEDQGILELSRSYKSQVNKQKGDETNELGN